MMHAELSQCKTYRYTLERGYRTAGKTYAFFGVNPSTADAFQEDATTRKWRGFVERWDGAGYVAGNAFAHRATDVRELAAAADPVGPHNDWWLDRIMERADVLVPCWGSAAKLPRVLRPRLDVVLGRLRLMGKPVMCLGRTNDGQPKHPLMLSYQTELEEI